MPVAAKPTIELTQQADDYTFLRRVFIDTIGLPPTIEEIDDFLADDSPNAFTSGATKMFPLRLTPFELFLVQDEAHDCPMTSFIELHFSNPMQPTVLQAALHHTVHQHPLLASRLIVPRV